MKSTDFKSEFRSTPDTVSENDNLANFLREYINVPEPESKNAIKELSDFVGEVSMLNEILLGMKKDRERSGLADWLTSRQVRIILNKSERSIRSLRKNGKLKFSPIGQKIFYRKADVDFLLQEAAT